MTKLQRASMLRLLTSDPQTWHRSRTAGERVTLASLESSGFAERRPWRGDGVSRDSAFEYRPTVAMSLAFCRSRAGREELRTVDELVSRRSTDPIIKFVAREWELEASGRTS